MRFRDQLLDHGGVEHLAADRHPLAHVVEQRPIYLLADSAAGLLQQGVRVREQLVVRGQLVEPEVSHADHVELLQVGVRVPPAAPLVEPYAVGEHLPERALGLLQVETAQRRLRQPLGADLRIRPVEAKRTLHGDAQLVAAEPGGPGIVQSPEKTRAHEADKQKVVEVAGLQRRVLAVVGEAEQLPRVQVHLRVVAVHPAQRTGHEHGGCRAAALCRQRGEPGAIPRRAALGVPAAETEAELARQEPHVRSRTDPSVGGNFEAPRPRFAVVPLEPRAAGWRRTRASSPGSPRRGRRT